MATEESEEKHTRWDVLDGWRGISILAILACHLIWLGPKPWQLNETAGPFGMALFFILSGFLITSSLLDNIGIREFLIRRVFRIVPLAWVYILIALTYIGAEAHVYVAHYLFYANLPPFYLTNITAHFWSLCVEMHFYFGIALLVALFGRRSLMTLPLICVAVTAYRVFESAELSIVTWLRADEILAGGVLALAYHGRFGERPMHLLGKANIFALLVLFILSCHPDSGPLNYLRPYFAAFVIGATLANSETRFASLLKIKILKYIAKVSYAVYVIHPLIAETWLGAGEGIVKYLKRPLLFAAIFGVAHVSTFYFERRWINLGRQLTEKPRPVKA